VLGAASAVDNSDADATGGPGRIRGSHNLERLPPEAETAPPSALTCRISGCIIGDRPGFDY
jgi:hypothetical protein